MPASSQSAISCALRSRIPLLAGCSDRLKRVWLAVFRFGYGFVTILSNAHDVLIVDDHPSFRATARAMLQADGFDVVGEAENGASASRARRSYDPTSCSSTSSSPTSTGSKSLPG